MTTHHIGAARSQQPAPVLYPTAALGDLLYIADNDDERAYGELVERLRSQGLALEYLDSEVDAERDGGTWILVQAADGGAL